MSENEWFVMRPQKAQAYGRPEAGGFLVRKGSTAMREGSPRVKRDREERDRLVRQAHAPPCRRRVLQRRAHRRSIRFVECSLARCC